MILKYKKLDPTALAPKKNNPLDAGYDLHALNSETIKGVFDFKFNDDGEREYNFDYLSPTKIDTGIALEIPTGYFGLICDRSGLGSKGLKVFGGVIDSTYRGTLKVCLLNLSGDDLIINKGDRVAQLLILPIASPELIEAKELTESVRQEKGFGSSGMKEFHE